MSEALREAMDRLSIVCVWHGKLAHELAPEDRAGLDALLAAHIYGICPECGGSRKLKCARCNGVGELFAPLGGSFDPCSMCGGGGEVPCPACADAPVAIVSAALREQARDALWAQEDTRDLISAEVWLDAALDAILSTVLGRVRYAKEIIEEGMGIYRDRDQDVKRGDGSMLTMTFTHMEPWKEPHPIAVLEEAGKEE